MVASHSIGSRVRAAVLALFGAANQAAAEPVREIVESTESFTLRRWEAARTDRTNSAHWSRATGQPINSDLAGSLKNLRARCTYEISNNPIVEGMINSHSIDVIGPNGPSLQVISDNDTYNAVLETEWRRFWCPNELDMAEGASLPDAAGRLSGPELLRSCVPLWWSKGQHLLQMTSAVDVPLDQIALRILAIDPDRLDTDPKSSGDPNVALGVRRDRIGRPLGYQIADEEFNGPFRLLGAKYTEYPADEIIHQFETLEPGQVCGVPWLASGLPTIAELRDFDANVLRASKLAASQGIVWYTAHPDAPFMLVNDTTTLEPNVERTGPPGWKPHMVDPKQPAANYVAFRTERLRELGRGRSIPLMKILLGSEKHNFASARMDNQNYQRACEALQTWTERQTLCRILASFLREARLLRRGGRFVLPPRPAVVMCRWLWPKQPHVDPVKEANAERIQLENGTLPYAEACANNNRDEDQVIPSRAKTARKLETAGLPPVVAPSNVAQPEEEEDEETSKPKPRDGSGIDPDGMDDDDDAGLPDDEEVLSVA